MNHSRINTGLLDADNNPIFSGDRIRAAVTGETYLVNKYRQAVPDGDGKAVDAAELLSGVQAYFIVNLDDKPAKQKPAATTTQVCKECGKELPMEKFEIHPRWKKRMSICEDCMREIRSKGQKKHAAPAAAETAPAPAVVDSLAGFTDEQLAAELRKRGYTLKATRTIVTEL